MLATNSGLLRVCTGEAWWAGVQRHLNYLGQMQAVPGGALRDLLPAAEAIGTTSCCNSYIRIGRWSIVQLFATLNLREEYSAPNSDSSPERKVKYWCLALLSSGSRLPWAECSEMKP